MYLIYHEIKIKMSEVKSSLRDLTTNSCTKVHLTNYNYQGPT